MLMPAAPLLIALFVAFAADSIVPAVSVKPDDLASCLTETVAGARPGGERGDGPRPRPDGRRPPPGLSDALLATRVPGRVVPRPGDEPGRLHLADPRPRLARLRPLRHGPARDVRPRRADDPRALPHHGSARLVGPLPGGAGVAGDRRLLGGGALPPPQGADGLRDDPAGGRALLGRVVDLAAAPGRVGGGPPGSARGDGGDGGGPARGLAGLRPPDLARAAPAGRPAPRPPRRDGAAVRVPVHRHPPLGHRRLRLQRRRDGRLAELPLCAPERRPGRAPRRARGRRRLRPRDGPHPAPAPRLVRPLLPRQPWCDGALRPARRRRRGLPGRGSGGHGDGRAGEVGRRAGDGRDLLLAGLRAPLAASSSGRPTSSAAAPSRAAVPTASRPTTPARPRRARRRRSARSAFGSASTLWRPSPPRTASPPTAAPGVTGASPAGSASSRLSRAAPWPSASSSAGWCSSASASRSCSRRLSSAAFASGAFESLRGG